jgi:hypothetical protein
MLLQDTFLSKGGIALIVRVIRFELVLDTNSGHAGMPSSLQWQ